MIRVDTKEGVCKNFEVSGDIFSLAADCCIILRGVYTAIKESADDESAHTFAEIMRGMVAEEESLFEAIPLRSPIKIVGESNED